MSMIRRDPTQNSVVTFTQEAGAGAAVMVIAVLAVSFLVQTVVTAVITLAVILVIGAILWYAVLRKRFSRV